MLDYNFIKKLLVSESNFEPAFDHANVPVAFSSDDGYAPFLGVTIQSLISYSNPKNNYDILILDGGIDDANKSKIMSMSGSNICIRFIDLSKILAQIDTSVFKTRLHFSMAAYYRLFLPLILKKYEKIIYLDCDLMILRDIALLYQTDLAGNCIAAARDFFIPIEVKKDPSAFDYYHNTLKMHDIHDYFNSGVLILNLDMMCKQDMVRKLFDCLQEVQIPRYVDQCILNSVLQGKVCFLDPRWNNMVSISRDIPDYREYCSEEWSEKIELADRDPFIVHFTGGRKPWNNPYIVKAEFFWNQARKTSFYEEILFKNIRPKVNNPYGVLKEYLIYSKNKKKYWRYKLLSKITLGKMRQRYKNKRRMFKQKLKEFEKLLGN